MEFTVYYYIWAMLSAFIPIGHMAFWKIPSNKFLVDSVVRQACTLLQVDELLHCASPCFNDKKCFFFCFQQPSCMYQTSIACDGRIGSRSPFKDIKDCYIKMEAPDDLKNSVSVAANETVNYSTYIPYYGPWLAVDGNRTRTVAILDSTCTFSTTEEKPWWLVDLNANFAVISVNLTSPDQSLYKIVDSGYFHDMEVRIGNKGYDRHDSSWMHRNAVCYSYNGSGDPFLIKTCSPLPIIGRFVTVQIVSDCNGKANCSATSFFQATYNTLALCEVDVYGILLL